MMNQVIDYSVREFGGIEKDPQRAQGFTEGPSNLLQCWFLSLLSFFLSFYIPKNVSFFPIFFQVSSLPSCLSYHRIIPLSLIYLCIHFH